MCRYYRKENDLTLFIAHLLLITLSSDTVQPVWPQQQLLFLEVVVEVVAVDIIARTTAAFMVVSMMLWIWLR